MEKTNAQLDPLGESETKDSTESTTSDDADSNYADAENEVRIQENLETMESSMRPYSTLSFEGNLKENWQKWKRKYYLKATDLQSKIEDRKIAVLLQVAGEEAMDKFETFGLPETDKKKLDKVYKAFDDYCTPKVNESIERHVFNSRAQKVVKISRVF